MRLLRRLITVEFVLAPPCHNRKVLLTCDNWDNVNLYYNKPLRAFFFWGGGLKVFYLATKYFLFCL